MPRPLEPHSALGLRPRFSALWGSFGSCSQQSSFPPMHRGIDKNTGNAHYRSQRMHQNAGFYIKYTQKIPGVATPGPPPPGGRGDICSHPSPCPPARCWCPSASSRLATALVGPTGLSIGLSIEKNLPKLGNAGARLYALSLGNWDGGRG